MGQLLSITVCALLLIASSASAQTGVGGLFIGTVGRGGAIGGTYRSGVFSADAVFSNRLGKGLRWGVAGTGQASPPTGDDCVTRGAPPPEGKCLQPSPTRTSWSLLISRVLRENLTSFVNLSLGPSLVREYRRDRHPQIRTDVGGLTGRIDAGSHLTSHVSFVLSLRATLSSNMPRNDLGMYAIGVGLGIR